MDHTKFILKVTAGHEYKNQHEVHVNTSKPYQLDTPYLSATIHVRVQDFRGLPKSSPSTSPYFSHPLHTTDRYSISFRFTPKSSINGNDLVFGNDFDHPIRDRLPPGFGYAFNYVKSWIDPGLDGDPMSDEPWLYGPLLSSVNVLRIGGQRDEKGGGQPEEKAERKKEHEGEHAQIEKDDEEVDVVEEGASDTSGEEVREQLGLPDDSKSRMKFFLDEMKRKEFEFEQGRCYSCDFFNGYLDFNEFALRLPLGFTMNIVRYWDGQPLRYVFSPIIPPSLPILLIDLFAMLICH